MAAIDPLNPPSSDPTRDENAIGDLLKDVTETGELATVASTDEKVSGIPDRPSEAPPREKPTAENKIEEAKVVEDAKITNSEDDKEFEKQLEEVKPKSPQQEKGYGTLRAAAKEERLARRKIEAELKKWQEEHANVKALTPEIESELEELRKLRKFEDPANDPEIKEKFTNKLESAKQQSSIILSRNGLKAEFIDLINQAGGLIAVSKSDEVVPALLGGERTWSDWVENVLLPKTPFLDRERLKGLMLESATLADAMEQEIASARTDSEGRMKAKFEKMGQQFQEGVEESVKALGPIASKWDYPKDATPEQKEKVDTHNRLFEQSAAKFTQLRDGIGNPKTAGQITVLAAHSLYLADVNQKLMDQLEAKDKTISEQEERLNKIKGSSQAAHRTNAQIPAGSVTPPKLTENTSSAIDRMMSEYD